MASSLFEFASLRIIPFKEVTIQGRWVLELLSRLVGVVVLLLSLANAQQEKFTLGLGNVSAQESAPLVVNLDGDSSNGLEIVAAKGDGTITAVSSDGSILWTQTSPNFECSLTGVGNKLKSSVAVGDLDGDGVMEVVVGYGGIDQNACGGGVVAFKGTDGTLLWHFDVDNQKNSERLSAVFGTPGIADVGGDTLQEVCFGSHDRYIYCLNARGRVVFRYTAADTVFSSPAFANLDDDPALEMIMGNDISRNDFLGIENGGFFYAFNIPEVKTRVQALRTLRECKKIRKRQKRRKCKKRNRAIKQKLNDAARESSPTGQVDFGFREESAFLWKRAFDQTIQSSAVVGDLLPSSRGLETVVGSGCYFPENSNDKLGKWVKVLNAQTGRVLVTLETENCMRSSPAVADVNGDGLSDVVVLQGGGSPQVIAWTPETNTVLWTAVMTDSGLGNHARQAVVADLDGNGSLEVLVGNNSSVRILKGTTGEELSAMRLSSGTVTSAPAVGDIDGDGRLDVVAVGKSLDAWSDFEELGSEPGSGVPYATPYSMFRGDAQRQGRAAEKGESSTR